MCKKEEENLMHVIGRDKEGDNDGRISKGRWKRVEDNEENK